MGRPGRVFRWRMFPPDGRGDGVGRGEHVADRFGTAPQPHLLRVENKVVFRLISGEEPQIGGEDSAAAGGNADSPDRLPGDFLPMFVARLNLFQIELPGQQQKAGEEKCTDQQDPELPRCENADQQGRGFFRFHYFLPRAGLTVCSFTVRGRLPQRRRSNGGRLSSRKRPRSSAPESASSRKMIPGRSSRPTVP